VGKHLLIEECPVIPVLGARSGPVGVNLYIRRTGALVEWLGMGHDYHDLTLYLRFPSLGCDDVLPKGLFDLWVHDDYMRISVYKDAFDGPTYSTMFGLLMDNEYSFRGAVAAMVPWKMSKLEHRVLWEIADTMSEKLCLMQDFL